MAALETNATIAFKGASLLAAVVAGIMSPVLWAGFIGAAFGVAFAPPVTFRIGLLWLAFGMAVSIASNEFLIAHVGGAGAGGTAFFVAFLTVKFKDDAFASIASLIKRKGDQV